jgi:hypothetical protein
VTAHGWRKRQIMQWVPNDEHKRRDEAFADFIGGVAYEEDRSWSKEVWDAAWSARREWVGLTDEEMRILKQKRIEDGMTRIVSDFGYIRSIEAKLREKNT